MFTPKPTCADALGIAIASNAVINPAKTRSKKRLVIRISFRDVHQTPKIGGALSISAGTIQIAATKSCLGKRIT
jgi:hypothetical protein